MTALAERSDSYPPPPVAMEPWCGDGLPAADPAGASKYYRARYYDPKIGRFISEDPIGFMAGVKFYAYVENNPVNYTDPYGLQSAWPWFPSIVVYKENRDRSQNRTARDRRMDPSNRVTHCTLVCELEQQGGGPGRFLSWAADTVVVTGWPPPGITIEDDPKDRQANACGRWAARNGRNCQEFCREILESGQWRQE